MKRILILGLPGSGKTTYAIKLSAKLGIKHIECDQYFWKDQGSFLDQIKKEISEHESWICEGHFNKIKDVISPHLTEVIWLDYPYPLILWRWFFRSIRTRDFGDWKYLTREKQRLIHSYEKALQEYASCGLNVSRVP